MNCVKKYLLKLIDFVMHKCVCWTPYVHPHHYFY